jgi:hypothetical protein
MTKIVKLEAENFKRLKAVEIHPDGNTVVISGRNAQGKSSVLDAIMAALAGKAGSKELVRPIRDGETKATVTVTLDELVIERRWTPSGSTVTVSPVGGNAKLNSPQAVLDKLIGSLSFDPLAFAEAAPKQQVETLIDLVGREEFDQIAQDRKSAYDDRTDINREVKRLRSQVESYPTDVPMVGSVERVDVAAVADELGIARRKLDLTKRWHELRDQLADVEAEARSLPETREVDTLAGLLADAERVNALSAKAEQRQADMGQLADAERRSAQLTQHIEELDQAKAELLERAELPVDGLTFDEDGVELNGVPFVQSSAAERLKVSVAMAMALNPELKVICIRDASLLDSESKQALVDLAVEHDYQIWYEVVGDASKIGVVIEDGQVKA